jgi:hypothetical protein
MRRAVALAMVATLAIAAGASARAPGRTYRGAVHCIGRDLFEPGGKVVRFNSHPNLSVAYGPSGKLISYTFLVLGKPNQRFQVTAAQLGDRFTYKSGAHIQRPGTTIGTIVGASRLAIAAALAWSSPKYHYVGSGTYSLQLRPTSAGRLDYQSMKAFVKTPDSGKPTKRNPVVRRSELCVGTLSP